jgi:hypothetical protein
VATIDQIYQLTDNQRFPTGEIVQNVYFFADEGASGSAEDLTLAFNNDMLTGIIRDLQSDDFEHISVEAHSLGAFDDFYVRVLTGAVGGRSGDCLPAFNAINFTLRTSSRAVRPGSKRIGGLPDETTLYLNGQVVDSAMLGFMEDIRVAMATVINAGEGDYTPVVVKRIPVAATEDHGAYYRLPGIGDVLEYFPVVTCLVNPIITHQVSRGNGR